MTEKDHDKEFVREHLTQLRRPVVVLRYIDGLVDEVKLFFWVDTFKRYVIAEAVEDYNSNIEYGDYGEPLGGARPIRRSEIDSVTLRWAMGYWRYMFDGAFTDNYVEVHRMPHPLSRWVDPEPPPPYTLIWEDVIDEWRSP